MTKFTKFFGAGLLIATVAGVAVAESHLDPAIAGAIKARQAHMTLYGHNIGVLGAMAQDKMPYDAATAQASASNLAALSALNQMSYWPVGSDTSVGGNRALPAIWENTPDVISKAGALAEAAVAMDAAAGVDLDSLKAAMGPLGAACGACHEAYRQPNG